MKLFRLAGFVLTVVFVAHAAADSWLRETVTTYQNRYGALALKGDAAGLEKLMLSYHTKDFVYWGKPGKDGKVRGQSLSAICASSKQTMSYVHFLKHSWKIQSIRQAKDSAVVTIQVSMSGQISKTRTPDHRPHVGTAVSTKQETWTLRGGKWKMSAAKDVGQDLWKMDGKS